MKEISVSEAFEMNDNVHEKLKSLLSGLTTEQAALRDASQDQWSVLEIVEHISIVEAGIAGLCAKLLLRAKENGAASNGKIRMSDEFLIGSEKIAREKLQAPERVCPTGAHTIEESLTTMADTHAKLEELRPLFEEFSSSDSTFPHPYLGELTAAEWLCLIGGHETRHMRQIKRILNSQTGEAL